MTDSQRDSSSSNNHNGPEPDEGLGVAGGIAKAFIHSPLSPLFYMAMLALGLLGLMITPRQEDPQISVPMIDVFFSYPGASAKQVGRLAVDPLQRIMSEIPGVEHVYGAAMRDQGMVTVQFEVGEALGPSIVKVHDKLQTNLDQIPPGVSQPLVKPKGIDDVPVVTLTLWSSPRGDGQPMMDDGQLRMLALDVLQKLKEIPNTGSGFVVGGRAEQLKVEVMPERLSGFGIGLGQVAQTIQTANSENKAGYVEAQGRHFTVYTGSFLQTAEDVRRLVVGTHHGSPVYVRDVAQVSQEPEEPKQLVAYYTGRAAEGAGEEAVNGLPAVTIAVAKKEGSNGVTVAEAILNRTDELKGRLIPREVNVAVTRNYGQTANQKVNELIKKLFIATGAVTVLVLFALGWRPALVVTLVIPVVLLITVFAAYVVGYTIDRVSLFALIFAIGILVDDAIVVVENIYRRWLLKGAMDTPTAVDAVREVGNPTILATFTVVAALLPMGFVTGMMGPYMAPIPHLGSVAMVFSLLAAFVFTPYFAMRFKPSLAQLHKAEAREHQQQETLESWFRRILVPLIQNRLLGWAFLASLVVVFFVCVSLFYFKVVPVKMLPLDNKPEFSVVVDMPEGTALPVTANVAQQIAERLRDIEEVTAIQTYVGTARPFDFNGMVRHYYLRDEPWQAEVQVQLLDKHDRERTSHELAVQARALIEEFGERSGAALTVVEMPPGPPVLQSVVAEVHGWNDDVRRRVAADLTETFRQTAGLTDVDNYMPAPYEVWRFEVDTEKAVRRGISVDDINRNLDMAMGDYVLGDLKKRTVLEPTYIVMQIPLASRAQVNRLKDLPIASPEGASVPLAELGRFVRAPQDTILYYKDLRPVEYVVADVTGRLAAPIYGMLDVEAELEKGEYRTPDGLGIDAPSMGTMTGPPDDDFKTGFEWAGEWTVTYETFRDMGIAFAAALVLIYILVVWEFGNFMVPLVIMAPIPLTLVGIVPGHALMELVLGSAEFTATSMIGFIALAGIIVRNSILLVDFAIQELRRGVSVQEAVIQACKARTRPIVITALALVAGSSVIITDPIFQGMAVSLFFGVLVSTLLTLVVIPLGCISASNSMLSLAFPRGEDDEGITPAAVPPPPAEPAPAAPGWRQRIAGAFEMVFYMVRALFIVAWLGIRRLVQRLRAAGKQETQPAGRWEAEPSAPGGAPEPPGETAQPATRRPPEGPEPEPAKPAVVAETETPSEPRAQRAAPAETATVVESDSGPAAPVAPRRRRRRAAEYAEEPAQLEGAIEGDAAAEANRQHRRSESKGQSPAAPRSSNGRRRRGIRLKES
jgi:multidrug efflux pump subunit AcrB